MTLNLPARKHRMRIDPAYSIVNIVLLLIFFFLISGQDTSVTSELQLAETTELPPGSVPPPLLEIISADDWRLNGQPVRPELLGAALPVDDQPVHVTIDRAAPSALLLQVLRHPQLADRPVRLVTRHGGQVR